MRWLTLFILLVSCSTLRAQLVLQNAAEAAKNRRIIDREEENYINAKKLTYGIYTPRKFSDLKRDVDIKKAMVNVGTIVLLDGYPMKVVQVMDKTNSVIDIAGNTIWLTEFPTDELAADDNIRIIDKVEYIGIKPYQPAKGEKQSIKTIRLFAKDVQELQFDRQYRLYEMKDSSERVDVKYFEKGTKEFVGEKPDYSEARFKYTQLTDDDDKQFLKDQIKELLAKEPLIKKIPVSSD
jgi:hypothetical protein